MTETLEEFYLKSYKHFINIIREMEETREKTQ
jgi:hypothetical protein